MTGSIISIFITFLFTVVMVQQARRASPSSHRRRAFLTAAGVFSVFTLLNILKIVGIEMTATLSVAILLIVCLLMLQSLVFLYLAWKGGELQEQIEQAQRTITQERKRRRK